MLSENSRSYRLTFLALWLLVFTVPFESMIVIPGLGTINRLVGIMCVGLAVFAVVKNGVFRVPGVFLITFAVYLLWSLTTFFWTIDPEQSKVGLKTLGQLLVFAWLIWEFAAREREQTALLAAYVFGAYISIASILYYFILGIQSSWFRYSAHGFDPNEIGLILALGVPIAWRLALTEKRWWLALLYYLYVPLAFLAITLTASRTAFVVVLVAALYVLWTLSRAHWVSRLASLVIVLAAIGSLLFLVPEYSLERLSSLTSNVMEGRLNSREQIWSRGLSVFSENPLLGVGITGFRAGVEQYKTGGFAPHNLFLSVLVEQGLIGLMLFLAVFMSAAFNVVRMPTLQSRMWIVLIVAWGLGVMTLGWQNAKPTWFLFAMLAVQGASAVESRTGHLPAVVTTGAKGSL